MSETWDCVTPGCSVVGVTRKRIMDHLKAVHGMNEHTPFTQKMISHLDARDYYATTYELRSGDVVLQKQIEEKRDKDDLMYWETEEE